MNGRNHYLYLCRTIYCLKVNKIKTGFPYVSSFTKPVTGLNISLYGKPNST